MPNSTLKFLFAALSFVVPFVLFYVNAGDSLGFADAGEFALVSKIFGIAHPPGFPAYVLLGGLWAKFFGWLMQNHVMTMLLFSMFCSALAAVFLFFTTLKIVSFQNNFPEILNYFISLSSAILFASGAAVWYWSHSVEVYSLQILAFALLTWGMVYYQFHQDKKYILIGAIGIAIGLANHHLTMILFLPFALVFLFQKALIFKENKDNAVQKKKANQNNSDTLLQIIVAKKHLLLGIAVSLSATIFFYGFMVWRANVPMPFKFGSPHNFKYLLYHLSGGAWIKNTSQVVEGIIQMRIQYFAQLTIEQLGIGLLLLLAAIIYLWKRKMNLLLISIVGYYFLVLFYQLRIDQTSDTDAYMLLPFYGLHILMSFGWSYFENKKKWAYPFLLLLIVLNPVLNYAKTDTVQFDVSKSIMKTLDQSAPQGSIIIMADWTTVAQFYYYRIVENFRPDLIVINYDLKFTHKDILPIMYPQFYAFIKNEYDHFIDMLLQYHPEQAYNTGCTIDNIQLRTAYRALFFKMQQYADKEKIAFLTDPKTFVYSLQDKLLSTQSSVSGMFVSKSQQATGMGNEFLELNYAWLHSKRLLREPGAGDKLVDLEAMYDFHRNYYKSIQDEARYQKADAQYYFIKSLQKKMKEEMPFLFRPKGK